jgi:hypothetical protein
MQLDLIRGDRTVTLPLLDAGGTPLFSVDFGKPNANIRNGGGSLNPRVQDQYSGNINYTLVGRFSPDSGVSDPYSEAQSLAEIIKEDPFDDMFLDVSQFNEFADNAITVSPTAGGEGALSLSYPPGHRNYVDFQVQLTEYAERQGSPGRSITTPTATGTGPIELKAGGNSVPITSDVQLSRTVGRPNDTIRKRSEADTPTYYPKRKVTYDMLSLQFEFTENTISNLQTVGRDIFRTRLGRSGIKIDFNGLYGYGEFTVFPEGSAPFRQQRLAGFADDKQRVPTLDLRVITV